MVESCLDLQHQRHKENTHQISWFLCRMENVVWTDVHTICLLQVVDNEFEMDIIRNYGARKTDSVKLWESSHKISTGISAEYIQYF